MILQDLTDAEDHPRACGEKRMRRAESRHLQGSPPRLRGEGSLGK